LERLAAKIDELVRPRLQTELADAMKTVALDAERWGWKEERAEEERTRQEGLIREEWAVVARATRPEFSTNYSGGTAEVLGALESSRVHSFVLSVRKRFTVRSEIEVRFDRRDGCRVSVDADDPEWVRGAFTTLVDEIRVGVPRWHILRLDRFRVPAALLLGSIFGGGIAVAIYGLKWAAAGVIWGSFVIGSNLAVITTKALPGFEILPHNGKSKGTQRLRWIGGFCTSVAASIVAVLIYPK